MNLVRRPIQLTSIVMGALAFFAHPISAQTSASSTPAWTPSIYATSATAGTTGWLTLPMGHLDDSTNTFWQIFHFADASGSITNESIATGVATNGGILLGNIDDPSFAVAVRPSIDLAFTPILLAPNSGAKKWQVTTPISGSISRLSQLGDRLIAVSINAKKTSIIERTASSARWRTLDTLNAVQIQPAFRSCSPTAITSVTFDQDGSPIIGAACAKPGIVGLFRYSKGHWNRLLNLHTGTPKDVISVLSLSSCGVQVCGLVASNNGKQMLLSLLTLTPTGANLNTVGIAPNDAHISAIGGIDTGGVWLLYRERRLLHGIVKFTSNSRSITLPVMPTDAATLVSTASGEIYSFALADGGDKLLESKLSTNAPYHWNFVATRHFPIPYGSSS